MNSELSSGQPIPSSIPIGERVADEIAKNIKEEIIKKENRLEDIRNEYSNNQDGQEEEESEAKPLNK